MQKQIIDTNVLQATVNFLQTLPHKDVHVLLDAIVKSTFPHPDNTPIVDDVPAPTAEETADAAEAEFTENTPAEQVSS